MLLWFEGALLVHERAVWRTVLMMDAPRSFNGGGCVCVIGLLYHIRVEVQAAYLPRGTHAWWMPVLGNIVELRASCDIWLDSSTWAQVVHSVFLLALVL